MPQDLQGAADLLDQLLPTADDTDSDQTFDQAHEERIKSALNEDSEDAAPDAAAPVATSETVDSPEVPAPPTPAELRVKEMQARLAKLQEERKNSSHRRELEASKRAADERERALAAREAVAKKIEDAAREQEAAWKASLKDPIAAYKRLGISPTDAYDALSTAAERANSPEAKEEALREKIAAEIKKEYAAKFSELEEMKARLAQFEEYQSQDNHSRAAQAKAHAEDEFFKSATSNGNEVLADYYERDELVQLGHALANEFIASKTPFTVADIANELRERLEAQLKRADEKRNRRTQATPNASQTGANAGAASKSANVIGATTASSVASSVPKRLTPEQRRAEAARMLASSGLVA